MSNSGYVKIQNKFVKEYGFEINTQEAMQYGRFQKNMASRSCGVVFGAIVILFIVLGIVFNMIPWSEYSLIPLGVVACLTIMDANSITKKMKENDKQFMQYISQQRQAATQPTTLQVPATTPMTPVNKVEYQTTAPRPKPAAECPTCGQTIAVGSNPCPYCGTSLLWD